MSPLELLGLGQDADERMVKRAYAQRLRQCRPEDDPEAFQQLHAIYEAALEQCRHAAAGSDSIATVTPSIESTQREETVSPSPESMAPEFAHTEFQDEVIRLGGKGDAHALQAVLDRQPALWSLRLKSQVAQQLFARLAHEVPPMSAACIATLLRFFDLDHVLDGNYPPSLLLLQRRMQLAWDLQPQHREALAERLGMRSPANQQTLKAHLRQLTRPFHVMQAALIGSIPERATALARFITRLSLEHPDDLSPPCDPRQINFWLQAVDRRQIGYPRLLIGAVRCAVALLCAALIGTVLGVVARTPPERISLTVLAWVVGLAAVPCVIFAIWMTWLPVENWQATPEHQPVRWPWLNLLLVPLLCAVGLALSGNPLTLPPLFTAIWIAFRRCIRRNASTFSRVTPRMIWFGMFIVFAASKSILATYGQEAFFTDHLYILAVIAMGFWGFDLWRHRRYLRVARTA